MVQEVEQVNTANPVRPLHTAFCCVGMTCVCFGPYGMSPSRHSFNQLNQLKHLYSLVCAQGSVFFDLDDFRNEPGHGTDSGHGKSWAFM